MNALKDFSTDQKNKVEELKVEQKELTTKTVEQLDRVTKSIETKLHSLSEQEKADSQLLRSTVEKSLSSFQNSFDKNVEAFNSLQREKFSNLEVKQTEMIRNTELKLELIKSTVEEKLEKTLSERIGHSFETVGKQLNEVQKGLGEMQTLAQDVGGLKKVLSNVKMRGGFGEVQLEMLLEQILAPDQYQAKVKIKSNSKENVEFAVKLPGREDSSEHVWLPIDAKFPKDIYESLQNAYEIGDPLKIEEAQNNLESTIKKMAKDISDKYINPPSTTDFAIMFLPFEGIYAEVVRKASLLEVLQKNFKVIVTGPTTLAAILNSLQMGFRTLAIQKRSSEVWSTLAGVKKEFETFGGLLEKAQKNIHTGLGQLEVVMDVRTRAIQRKLKNIEIHEQPHSLSSSNPEAAQQDKDEETV
ncbi:DNA recombination protein RmuC [Bdellovibrio bacteriovorus]|uniref:DNA recombination protein RmuC n=1 Tax=Bdellovibrio bacteriovorus TaxID=959 RepID=UPI0035A7010A